MLCKWVLISMVLLPGLAVAKDAGCPLRVIDWSASDSDDPTFDADTSRQLVEGLVAAAERDSAYAAADRNAVGGALASLSANGRFVAYDVLSLALRLRQLDCAVWDGTARDTAARYRGIISDGKTLFERLGGVGTAAMPVTFDWHLRPSMPRVKLAPTIDPARRSRGLKIAGGSLLGVGASFLAGSVILAVHRASYDPTLCRPNVLCRLSNGFGDFEIGAAVGFGVLGLGLSVVGGVVMKRAAHWAEKVVPVVSVSASGGKMGLVIPF